MSKKHGKSKPGSAAKKPASAKSAAAKPATAPAATTTTTSTTSSASGNGAAAAGKVPTKPPIPGVKELPSKEAALFKQVLKMYEFKQYKKGLKTLEQILKKVPTHGETVAMRGLFLSQLDRRDEGYEQVKYALELDQTSHIIWHVHGLMHRADKEYDDAIKCYKEALKIDVNNLQILRDLALLQIQQRDLQGYRETRHRMLPFFRGPNQRPQLIGLIVANAHMGEYDEALMLWDKCDETFVPKPDARNYEYSEFLLFRAHLLELAGRHEDALKHLETIEHVVCDVQYVKERRAAALLALGRHDHAMEAYTALLQRNPDNKAYITGFVAATREPVVDVLESLAADYPKSHLVKVMLLESADAESDVFQTFLATYLDTNLDKGVPSLFSNLKSLYTDAAKRAAIVAHLSRRVEQGSEGDKVWTLYYLAQLADDAGDLAQAMQYVESAIAQHDDASRAPLELVMLQARIHKHAGDIVTARETMNRAREMDLKDRYINTKCTKYMLRNNEVETAYATIKLFARPDLPDFVKDLVDMQSMAFAAECGEAFVRLREDGKALKRFHQIVTHFDEFVDDQFDFHTYCLRKMTLRAYADMLKWGEHVRDAPAFRRAARGAIRTYVRMHLQREAHAREVGAEAAAASLTVRREAVEKKIKDHKRKEDKKKKEGKTVTPTDADPDGEQFAVVASPLDAAAKLVQLLETACPTELETNVLAFDVYVRQAKWVLALRAAKRAIAIDPDHPMPKAQLYVLHHAVHHAGESIPDAIHAVLTRDLAAVADARAFPTSAADIEPTDLESAVAAAVAASLVGGEPTPRDVVDAVVARDGAWVGITYKQAERAAAALDVVDADAAQAVLAKARAVLGL
ncbi:hypothetical protein AMAG_12583 [Allomyces macrogynus ATCC 38327]|uniref:Uncharacterized protein n=1 Tax=Allomyces macrogynus (strain ATCC 38327) TaxID=578462 RepID=A0A0L0SZM2_ALLM3|nr:hypothetical protein AMAG_12583 [Allomyces macrogynus ATCC 38327]|eukprot:KNE67865.1 hypothetical protein AMAG_12583 [Allomyces macrogynus ATCC 38327]